MLSLVLVAAALAADPIPDELPLHGDSALRFATVEEGRAVALRDDDYLRGLSRFDLEARLRTRGEATRDDLRQFLARHVLPWEQEHRAKIAPYWQRIRQRLAPLRLNLPRPVLLVLTTGEEEGDAAYTRGEAIFIPRSMLAWTPQRLEHVLVHEVFHVLSRHDAALRAKLYALIGFREGPPVELPAGLSDRKISNPDGPGLNVFIDVTHEDQRLTLVPLLYSKEERFDPSRRDSFFAYLQFRLLVVAWDGERYVPRLRDGQPWLLDPEGVPSFHDQIGRNTKYIIHPDEVLADNFAFLALGRQNLPTPKLLEGMRALLTPPPTP